ncbi:hypothetical protein LSG16_04795 [Lactococcus cremoris]|uniref:hypothetical protein n=1 Tax=Lactococcus lactis subsp. cremoris TaxID=1359 RepID=UPI001E33F628|nr:hypothetical protein [Lactococcus cremoris]MCD6632150.1 hypothetical protein [Lactococcus cremoris]
MKKQENHLFEATYDISDKDWRIIRSMLRVVLRQSDTVRKSKNVTEAIKNITREEDRIVFFKYFIGGQSIVNISLEQYFSIESVKKYLKRGTKDFVASYNKGALGNLFIE